ncbi:hypothetical protein DFH09DRAFT_1286049 [Mycena vulgaris]|nr:hypothetical protein DFH09DRAFT_1286049 [Mycena vulgaris]
MSFSTTAASSAETCMSLAISCLPGPQSKSFEEVRINDYLESYRATGRPPPPCPPYPPDPAARAAQRLPPLFVPTPFSALGGPTSTAATPFGAPVASTSAAVITDPARLPVVQVFTAPVPAPEDERFASIVAAPEYTHWSHDELRFYAYLRNARQPPPGTPMFPFITALAPPPTLQPVLPLDNGGDQFVSISCRPEFAGHSVEELRLSFLRTGAELTSAQIFSGVTAAPTAAPTNPLLPPSSSLPPASHQSPFAPHPQPQSPFAPPPAPVSTPLFGLGSVAARPVAAPSQTFSFGGAQPQPPAPAPGVFGQPVQPPGSMFGQPAQPLGSIFGAPHPPAPAPAPSMFGQPQAPSMFGQPPQLQPPPPQAPPATGGFSFGATPTPGAAGGGGGTGFSFGVRRGF